jgi:hypothetical protein
MRSLLFRTSPSSKISFDAIDVKRIHVAKRSKRAKIRPTAGTLNDESSSSVMLKRVLWSLCLLAVFPAANAQPSGDLGWSTLANRFGATVDFPGALFTKQVSADEKLIAFRTADGRSRFEFFSIPNSRGKSPSQFARRAANGRENLDYKRITTSFIAASTIQSGRVLYRRCNFSRRMIHCIDLRYPAPEERAWDNTVTRISLSLRPL